MMKVFMIHSSCLDVNSGGGIHFYSVFLNLQKYYTVHSFVAKNIDCNSCESRNNIIEVPCTSFLLQITYQFFLCIYLFYFAIKLKPDLFYVRQSPLTFTPLIVSKIINIPYVAEMNGLPLEDFKMRYRTKNWFYSTIIKSIYILNERIVYKNSDKIIAVTEGIKAKIKKEYNISEDKLAVIENGADTSFFKEMNQNECIDKLNLSRHFNYICFVGELSPWHGVEDLIESLPFIMQKFQDTKLLIVGDGSMKKKLTSIGNKHNVLSNIIFTGFVPHEMVPYYINASDICVAPFIRERNEKTGISPLKIYEYMACAKPIVSSNIKGLEFIQRENVGILVEPEKPLEMANAIINLLKNEDLRGNMGENGRKYVTKNHSWECVAKKVTEVCEESVIQKGSK